MKIETFADGSTIETDETTGNRTVFGSLAHREYFKRLAQERYTASTPVAVIARCEDVDGSEKVQLIRRIHANPITREQFGEYGYEVWSARDPQNVVRCSSEENARKLFRTECLIGTTSEN